MISLARRKNFLLVSLLAGLCLIPSLAGAGQPRVQVIGEAYDLNNADLLYRETHCGLGDEPASEVLYWNPDGSLLAHKRLDYGSGDATPSFVQHDLRANEKITVSLDDEVLSMSIQGNSVRRVENQVSAPVDGEKPVVIDAGFDTYIRSNWSELLAGENRVFRFPLASRSRLVLLRVKPAACSYTAVGDQCFTLEPANWLLRMLAEPIELGYDPRLRRLSRYRGLSNINDENGKGHVVDILYRYLPGPAPTCRIDRLAMAGYPVDSRTIHYP